MMKLINPRNATSRTMPRYLTKREAWNVGAFRARVQQHDDEDKQHHDGAGVNDHLGRGDEFSAQLQVQNGERSHDADQRKRAGDGMRLHHQVDGAKHRDAGEDEERSAQS